MYVKAKGTSHVWIQFLTDTVTSKEASNVFYWIELTNAQKQVVYPALPFHYKECFTGDKPMMTQNTTNGQMINLPSGSYRVSVKHYYEGGSPKGFPGRQWIVRVVSPDVTKFSTVAKSNES